MQCYVQLHVPNCKRLPGIDLKPSLQAQGLQNGQSTEMRDTQKQFPLHTCVQAAVALCNSATSSGLQLSSRESAW